jgi:hypothetical protein
MSAAAVQRVAEDTLPAAGTTTDATLTVLLEPDIITDDLRVVEPRSPFFYASGS